MKDGAKYLLDTGLLGEINRRVLHPLGLAIIINVEDDGSCSFSNELMDCRDDVEGIEFSPELLAALQKKLSSAPTVDEFRKALYPPCGVQPLVEETEDCG